MTAWTGAPDIPFLRWPPSAPPPRPLRVLSLFHGMGCAVQAMRLAGLPWTVGAWAEIDGPASAVAAQHTQSPNLGDVTHETFIERAREHGPFDLCIAGTPCQDFSAAGRRMGLDGARGNLSLVTLGICRALGIPRLVVENVPGLLSSWSGGPRRAAGDGQHDIKGREISDFGAFLDAMGEGGFQRIGWRVLDAQYCGVAQQRRRLWIVADTGGPGLGPEICLLEPGGLRRNTAPRRPSGQALAEGRARGFGATGEIAPALTAKMAKGTGGPSGDECQNLVLAPAVFDETNITSAVNRATVRPDGPSPTLHSGTAQMRVIPVSIRGRDDGAAIEAGGEDGPSPALRASQGGSDKAMVAGDFGVRKLLPVEALRLQAMPDDWFDGATWRGKPISDTQKYKMSGNGWSASQAAWVFKRVALMVAAEDAAVMAEAAE